MRLMVRVIPRDRPEEELCDLCHSAEIFHRTSEGETPIPGHDKLFRFYNYGTRYDHRDFKLVLHKGCLEKLLQRVSALDEDPSLFKLG
jgi:hypothetical protein